MDFLKDVKVYYDGSHYIGIPHLEQPWKKRKATKIKLKNNAERTLPNQQKFESLTQKPKKKDLKTIFNNLYDDLKTKSGTERLETILTEVKKVLPEDMAKEYVKANYERKNRNLIERRKRLYRKVRQQEWDYFCTFTYDDKLHSEESFKKKLSDTFKHLANRKGWKYVGVWERSPDKQRLHFHGLFKTPQMIGEFINVKDYSTKNHKMQSAMENTYFLKRFGRNDFKKVEQNQNLNKSIRYLTKYLEKSGEKIVYSKGLYTYFVTDITSDDILCKTGVEDRKVVLADNFKCWDMETGEYFGTVSKETIEKLKKTN